MIPARIFVRGLTAEGLQEGLDGYAKVLLEKALALPKDQPHLVREFVLFAQENGGYTFEQTLDLFPAEVGGVGVKPWQGQGRGRLSAFCSLRQRAGES